MRFLSLLGKDVRVIIRSKALAATLVAYPLLMVAVLGLVFADPDQPIPVAMVVGAEGNNDISIESLTVSLDIIEERIDEVANADRYASREIAEEALRNGEVDAVIIFPDFFLANLIQDFRNQAEITVILDGSDPAKSTVAENIITAAVTRFNEEVVRYKVGLVVELLDLALDGDNGRVVTSMSFEEMLSVLKRIDRDENLGNANRAALNEAIDFLESAILELDDSQSTVTSIAFPIETTVQHIDSGVLEARDVVVPAAVALSIFWTGILATASLVVYERQSNAQVRLNVSPVRLSTVIASKLTLTGLIILGQSLLIIAIARSAWAIRMDNPALLGAVLAAGAFSAVGLGLFIAGLSRDTNGSTLLSVLAVFPMMFLSGLFFPISFMPEAAQIVARFLPLTYAVDGLRGAMLRNYSWENAQLDLVVLVALGLVTLVIGYARNRVLARGG